MNDVFLYPGELVVNDVRLDDPTVVRPTPGGSLVWLTANLVWGPLLMLLFVSIK